MKLSEKALGIKPSSTLSITEKAGILRSEGKNVISFSIGEPDFDTPEHIKKAAVDAINAGFTRYTAAAGIVELRKAVAKKLKEDNGLDYDYTQIVISNGAKHSLINALMAIINPGDEVIIPAPYWLSYAEMVRLAGGTPVVVYMDQNEGFALTRKVLEKGYSDKTKAVIITSPSNPTGIVMDESQLREIADFAVEKDIAVIADEIYEKLIYSEDKKHISIASLNKEIYDRTITINGVSKSYAMTGWRLGYACAPKVIMDQMVKIHQFAIMCAPTTSQYAAVEALRNGDDDVARMKESYNQRRNYLVHELRDMGLDCFEPYGAFYVFPSIKKFGLTSEEFATRLLEEEKVAVVPGTAFGDCGEGFLRISYAYSLDDLKLALGRVRKFVERLEQK
mgnify:CR=1 FL=1